MKKGSRKRAAKGMASYELLREVFKKPGAKNVAQELNLSLSLIHQWSRPCPHDNRSEAINPFDRVEALIQFTGDQRLAQWVCERAGGFFVRNVAVPRANGAAGALSVTVLEVQLACFAAFMALANAAKDGHISPENAAGLRPYWETAKSVTEGFIQACEQGAFQHVALFT